MPLLKHPLGTIRHAISIDLARVEIIIHTVLSGAIYFDKWSHNHICTSHLLNVVHKRLNCLSIKCIVCIENLDILTLQRRQCSIYRRAIVTIRLIYNSHHIAIAGSILIRNSERRVTAAVIYHNNIQSRCRRRADQRVKAGREQLLHVVGRNYNRE